ncbi:DDE-type integrase/transposase/recombinase [Mesorhizobium sp. M0601]|uniref:DDE-type integrase/transposase/recombinase n=1 Tax=Mesorhizobium sp. M0601 TaxID=2956969 RepID=UPI00333ACEB3
MPRCAFRKNRTTSPTKDDVWHLDEVAVRINGQKCWLWRAVEQDGYVSMRSSQTPSQRQGRQAPADAASEEAGSAAKVYGHRQIAFLRAAKRQSMPNWNTARIRGSNNRAENSHLPFRKRERTQQGFRSVGSLQLDLLRSPKPLRPIPDQPLGSTNSKPTTPSHRHLGRCTACLKKRRCRHHAATQRHTRLPKLLRRS